MKLGDGKGNNTGSELDRLKKLRNHNYRFKNNTKALKKNVAQDNSDDAGYVDYKA